MNRSVQWILGVCAAVSVGCGSDSSGVNGTVVKVATFNAGLARGYVDHAALRFDAQLSALSELDSVDILCLQEVWDLACDRFNIRCFSSKSIPTRDPCE